MNINGLGGRRTAWRRKLIDDRGLLGGGGGGLKNAWGEMME